VTRIGHFARRDSDPRAYPQATRLSHRGLAADRAAVAVQALLIAVAGESPEVITADLTATVFCDSAGVRALVRAHERADA